MNASNTLIDLFTRHRVASNLAMIMMVLSGLWAVDRINTQLDPTVVFPVVYVRANWQGASAEDMEQLAVLPIEQRLTNLLLSVIAPISHHYPLWQKGMHVLLL